MAGAVGQPLERADGASKVTGAARYTADLSFPGMVYAALAQSPIASGRLVGLDATEAAAMPGVLQVLTKDNVPRLAPCPILLGEEGHIHSAGQSFMPLQDDRIFYSGQPLALVVAVRRETALAAAARVRLTTEGAPPAAELADPRIPEFDPLDRWEDRQEGGRGDLALGLADAAVGIDATYVTVLQHHNCMEPHATVALWDGDLVTVYDPTTWVQGMQRTIATWFGLPDDHVRVVQHFVGGSFGGKGPAWPHVALTTLAARLVRRPVQLVLSRRQTFEMVGHRPRVEHHLQLGATGDGRLTALAHYALTHSSPFDGRVVAPVTKTSRKLYACPNVLTTYRMKHLNLAGPFTMRAPGEAPGLFALESAMDELAYALNIDPVALRLANDTTTDPDNGRPWSSRSLARCFAAAATRFGWDRRAPHPGSMRRGDWQVGWGTASMAYDSRTVPTAARVVLFNDGRVLAESATCDQGTGSYTVFPQIAADALGVPVERVRFALGDSAMPTAPISAGSMTMSSVGSAVQAAATRLRGQLLRLALEDADSPLKGAMPATIDAVDGVFSRRDAPQWRDPFVAILARRSLDHLEATGQVKPVPTEDKYSRYSFGAHFAEVLVHAESGELRLGRYVAAFGAGRIINPRLAHSQLIGGIVWGIGMALSEESRLDTRLGRVMNASLADYLVPVQADIPEIDAFFVDEADPDLNPIGTKGVGEIGTIGSAAAIANAVFHATGKRIRDLPITRDKLMA